MIGFFSRLFIKDAQNYRDLQVRRAYGVLCGIMGIILNLLLFAGKFIVGMLAGSIAVTADAFNNLSDAGSSVITLVGFRLAGQKPDPEHPFGHGRFEYISGLIVSVIILLMGVELGKASVEKILHPETAAFSWLTVGVLSVSIAVKLYMGLYNRRIGRKIESSAMKATMTDSISDAVATAVVLAATCLAPVTSWNIDGWCGAAVALMILYAGIKSAKETISPLLGQSPEPEFVEEIEQLVLKNPMVSGLHDLIVNDYGPGRKIISLHAEVPSNADIWQAHDAIDNIESELAERLGCLAVIHMDPIETDNEEAIRIKEKIATYIKTLDEQATVHDLRIVPGNTHTNVIFDAVLPYSCPLSEEEAKEKIRIEVAELEPGLQAVVHIDRAYSRK